MIAVARFVNLLENVIPHSKVAYAHLSFSALSHSCAELTLRIKVLWYLESVRTQ